MDLPDEQVRNTHTPRMKLASSVVQWLPHSVAASPPASRWFSFRRYSSVSRVSARVVYVVGVWCMWWVCGVCVNNKGKLWKRKQSLTYLKHYLISV